MGARPHPESSALRSMARSPSDRLLSGRCSAPRRHAQVAACPFTPAPSHPPPSRRAASISDSDLAPVEYHLSADRVDHSREGRRPSGHFPADATALQRCPLHRTRTPAATGTGGRNGKIWPPPSATPDRSPCADPPSLGEVCVRVGGSSSRRELALTFHVKPPVTRAAVPESERIVAFVARRRAVVLLVPSRRVQRGHPLAGPDPVPARPHSHPGRVRGRAPRSPPAP